ncbi:hypothetical protein Taro_013461 [Colocasia esculenta]|uniref:RING-type E3 ubiquitin transferase n=1 Tax=Colocasia esculenta TaxID=4460 RepID=A0A843UM67_COLES|nr:hypothetical protein [Colocasia esculenta]
MACLPVFSSLRRRKSPLLGAFFAPGDLSDLGLVQALASVSTDVVAASAKPAVRFQRANCRSLVRKVKIFLALFEFLREAAPAGAAPLPSPATLCFKELYILLHRARTLLDYCAQSSRLWLLLQNAQISGHFHDLTQEMSILLDVLPLGDLSLSADVKEQVELLQRQARRTKLFVDPRDEALRLRIYGFLDDFDRGRSPEAWDLREAFVDGLGVRDAGSCKAEVEFLEEQIYNQEEEVDLSVLHGVVALTRYARFSLFGFGGDDEDRENPGHHRKYTKGSSCSGIGDAFLTIPKDFCCPIFLDLMKDPVIVSTGQTYDRTSIVRWLEEGHCTCPNSGQLLTHTRLVPNRALRSLISQWCTAHGVPYEPPEASDGCAESIVSSAISRAAVEANRATARLLVNQLSWGPEDAKTVAARELRLLAKNGKENRACIAEAGAIPHLRRLLSSQNEVAQENSVTAILNLSIHDKNKGRIMEEPGCLKSIVEVLRHGWTIEARENAAATLFSLSAVHDYKKMISTEEGAVEALAGLLREGSARGKKDAVTALFNLSTHAECCERMVQSGAVSALVGSLTVEGVAEEAAGALALLVRQRVASEAVGKEDKAVAGLVGLMRRGSPRGKENAVAALLEMCRSGGATTTEKVARAPALGGLIQTLIFTGTKRARRKAASLARMCQRCDMALEGGWALEYALARSSSIRRNANFAGGDVSVSVPVAISVPVL